MQPADYKLATTAALKAAIPEKWASQLYRESAFMENDKAIVQYNKNLKAANDGGGSLVENVRDPLFPHTGRIKYSGRTRDRRRMRSLPVAIGRC